MYLIDFKDSRREAFAHGLLKGLAAPMMVFAEWKAPHIPPTPMVMPPGNPSVHHALEADWQRVFGDLNKVVTNYGNTTATAKNRTKTKRHSKRR
jgi:hypothetical protein